MKTKKFLLGLATAILTTTACQSNSYKISGVAEGFTDGDTLVLYEATTYTALDTIIVKDGKFSYKGDADSVQVCTLASLDQTAGVFFFAEPGTISMTLSRTDMSKVSGTKANDAWQAMNDQQAKIQEKVQEMYYDVDKEQDESKQNEIMEQYNKLQEEMTNYLLQSVEDNIDNEYGYFVLTQLGGSGTFSDEKVEELIAKLPENFRQRQAIQYLQKMFDDSKKTAVGQTLDDIILPTPDTMELNVLDEVKKNKVTVIDFWASWCGPCCREMPFMKSLLEKNQEKGFGIVGISLDQNADAWKTAIDELGLTWPQVWDSQQKTATAFHVVSIPFTVVVDQQGKILAKELRGPELESFVNEQLEK